MKKIKKLLSLILVFAVILSVIPAISVDAKSGIIKKTVKKKFIIEKFDDQDEIDDYSNNNSDGGTMSFSEAVNIINQCGGWKGLTTKDGDNVRLNIITGEYSATKGYAAQILKNVYGKYSCVENKELKSEEPATAYWFYKKIIKIAKKRHATEAANYCESIIGYVGALEADKISIILNVAGFVNDYDSMDPRVDYKYSE